MIRRPENADSKDTVSKVRQSGVLSKFSGAFWYLSTICSDDCRHFVTKGSQQLRKIVDHKKATISAQLWTIVRIIAESGLKPAI